MKDPASNNSAVQDLINHMYVHFVHKFNGDKEKAKRAVHYILNYENEQNLKYAKIKEFYKDAILIESNARKPYGDYREFNEEITRYLYGYGGEIKNEDFKKAFNLDKLVLKGKEVYSIFVDDTNEKMYFTFYENDKLYKQVFYVNMLKDKMINELDDYLFKANNDNEFGEMMLL